MDQYPPGAANRWAKDVNVIFVGFKKAWRTSLFDEEGETRKALAGEAGIRYDTLVHTADENKPDEWISMPRFLRILPKLTNLAVLEFLATLSGCVLVKMPDVRSQSPKLAATTSRAFAALIERHACALEDGRIDTTEARALGEAADDLIKAAHAMKLHAAALAEAEARMPWKAVS